MGKRTDGRWTSTGAARIFGDVPADVAGEGEIERERKRRKNGRKVI